MIYLRLSFVALIALPCADAAAAAAEQLSHVELMHDGAARDYELYVPPSDNGDSALPLVLVLHGRSGSGERMAHLTDFEARAAEHNFIVAYPDSLNGTWNYLYGIPGAPEGADDVGFLLRLIDEIGEQYRIDRKRLYVAGISNGGFMAQRLACEHGSGIAAFASVAASGYGAMPATCHADPPVDALYLHGTSDHLVPWTGHSVVDDSGENQLVTMPVSDSLKFWSSLNRCDPELEVSELARSGRSPETHVMVYRSKYCADGARVALYAIIGGGHNWPGRDGLIPPHISGAVNLDFHATDTIWSFFDHH
ncbi:MAG TPA: PHB depolymerase family esterase [Gammaproteobacteria bacterium]|nr:PHB depolymerase family esterase [Gammaproteobacteria bacterium]